MTAHLAATNSSARETEDKVAVAASAATENGGTSGVLASGTCSDAMPSASRSAGKSEAQPLQQQQQPELAGSLHLRADPEAADLRDSKRPRPEVDYALVDTRETDAQVKQLPERFSRAGLPPETAVDSFKVPDRPSPPLRDDDQDGHYRYEAGENFTSRYKILSKMGEGTFGRVLECWDRKHRDYVAIKVVRNVQKYRDAAMIELEVLNTLMYNDPKRNWHCVQLREWFDYRGHICMVFEKLGPSLFDFLRKNRYKPFPLTYVRSFALQLIESVAYLHRLTLVHTDLKPENILLLNNEYKKLSQTSRVGRRVPEADRIRLIDFGSATFDDQYHSTIVSTRHYRAPEVILGLGWSYACDMWSIGCILVELLTGDALFQTHENLEHLAMMETVLGAIPEDMAEQASKHSAKYFYKNRLDWPNGATSRESVRAVEKMQRLREIVVESGELKSAPALHAPILELLAGLLTYEPENRMTAEEALKHRFFSEATMGAIQQALAASSCGSPVGSQPPEDDAGGAPGGTD